MGRTDNRTSYPTLLLRYVTNTTVYPQPCDLHACLGRFARQGRIGWRVQIVRPARFARQGRIGWRVQIARPT